MNNELQKINAFLEEARNVWSVNPEFVLSRAFFELWENNFHPHPFRVEGETVTLGDQCFQNLQENAIGFMAWNEQECCSAFNIEDESSRKEILISFQEGLPAFEEQAAEEFDSEELGLGERIEVIYDVISEVHAKQPEKNVVDLTAKEYQNVLERLQHMYDDKTLRLMRRLPQNFVKRLLKKAAADMAVDELSNQLFLPLDGTYNAANIQISNEDSQENCNGGLPGQLKVLSRTFWQVLQDLEFVKTAAEIARDHEERYLFPLNNAEILSERNKELALCVTASPDVPLREGELLEVYLEGQNVGKFMIDLFDRDSIFGRLRGDDVTFLRRNLEQLEARSRNGSKALICEALQIWVDEFKKEKRFPMYALNAALGAESFTYHDKPVSQPKEHLDAAQSRAVNNAIEAENPVAVVQGPPGTGKTAVLETVVRQLLKPGARILVTAPSNAAVDNICQRLLDLALLRLGNHEEMIASDMVESCWAGKEDNYARFLQRAQEQKAMIFAGTHLGLLCASEIKRDVQQKGTFDVVIFDEAGMTRLDEFLLCTALAQRVVLFGDHKQLPPSALPQEVEAELEKQFGAVSRAQWMLTRRSALEWLVAERRIPLIQLQHSYRCQNPRLMRFASSFFYDANVKTSAQADYYQLSYADRKRRYPPATLRLYDTSSLAPELRYERRALHGGRPGIDNPGEVELCVQLLIDCASRYPLDEIAVITPYRSQVVLLRQIFQEKCGDRFSDQASNWQHFLRNRVSTVDSFQGQESDVVVISYVRSNARKRIGFIADPNRVNVACTRCRRELVIVADLETLVGGADNGMFARMKRAFRRDGEIIPATADMLKGLSLPQVVAENPIGNAGAAKLGPLKMGKDIPTQRPVQQQFELGV